MGIDTTDKTDTTNTPQEGSSMSDSRDEAIEAGARPIPAIPFNQMTMDGKLVHAITTNSHGITRLRKYSDSLADTIGEVRKEYREWEERLKGMRIELTPGEEQPAAMLERLAKHDESIAAAQKILAGSVIDGAARGDRIGELEDAHRCLDDFFERAIAGYDMCEAVRESKNDFLRALNLNVDDIPVDGLADRIAELEGDRRDIDGVVERALEGCDLSDWDSFCTLQQEARDNAERLEEVASKHDKRIFGLEDILKGHGDAPLSLSGMADEVSRISKATDDKPGWEDLDERIETRTANFITDDYLGDWMGDNGYIHESNFGEVFSEYVDSSDIIEEVQNGLDIGSIACEVQDNLDMYELASEVQGSLDMYSLAQELQDNLDLEDVVKSAMASHGCQVLKENPGFADELCEMVLASTESALDTRIHDALKDAVLEGLSRVTSIPAFQEATNLHLRMDELAKSVESVRAMVRDLEHF